MSHANGLLCERCASKLLQAHPIMSDWFKFVKTKFSSAHISWSFRDEKNQNEAFEKGLSKLKWPDSMHNKMGSRALDLFELGEDGKAYFHSDWYQKINEETLNAALPIRWGGTFKTFKDMDHFEMVEA